MQGLAEAFASMFLFKMKDLAQESAVPWQQRCWGSPCSALRVREVRDRGDLTAACTGGGEGTRAESFA